MESDGSIPQKTAEATPKPIVVDTPPPQQDEKTPPPELPDAQPWGRHGWPEAPTPVQGETQLDETPQAQNLNEACFFQLQ